MSHYTCQCVAGDGLGFLSVRTRKMTPPTTIAGPMTEQSHTAILTCAARARGHGDALHALERSTQRRNPRVQKSLSSHYR